MKFMVIAHYIDSRAVEADNYKDAINKALEEMGIEDYTTSENQSITITCERIA